MKNNRIRLTELQLRNVIKESVKKVINEMEGNEMNWREPADEYDDIDTIRLVIACCTDGDFDMVRRYLGPFNAHPKDIEPKYLSQLNGIMREYKELQDKLYSVGHQIRVTHLK